MPVNHALAEQIVAFMNELLTLDPVAVSRLVSARVACNKELADHPTVQVGALDLTFEGATDRVHDVGLLGILNGLCGNYDDGPRKLWGPVAAVYPGETRGEEPPDGAMIRRFEIQENE